MKGCEICGRAIKTGRKYCWEHRKNANSSASLNLKAVRESKQLYIHNRMRGADRKIILALFIIFIGGGIIAGRVIGNTGVGALIGLGVWALILSKIKSSPNKRAKKKAEAEIESRHPEFVNLAKKNITYRQNQKEFDNLHFK